MERNAEMTTTAFKIQGMDCAEEVSALKAELAHLTGIQNLAFDVLNRKMTVSYDGTAIVPDKIQAAVSRTGMTAELWDDEPKESAPAITQWSRTVLTTTSGILLACGFAVHIFTSGWRAAISESEGIALPWSSCILYISATVAGAWFVLPKAWAALRRFRPDMNLLMIVAVLGAIAIGEFFEGAMVAFLFAVSLALESWSVSRARRAISALMSLSPETARVIAEDGSVSTIDAAKVRPGSLVAVRPGEKFPLDGEITKGTTTVNQAPITGESVPVSKSVGSEVFAGTINEDGAVEFRTTKPAGDTTLAKIISMVGEAQQNRSPHEQWVERFARYYTPLVMCLALAVILLPPLFFGASWSYWLYNGLVLLVIACPCALVISTPVSIVAALALAARHGVLIKGGSYLEIPASLRVVAMDKTGTITAGQPELHEVVPLSGHTDTEVLELAAAVESQSEHPIARAVVRAANAKSLKAPAVTGFQAIKGKGATANVNGQALWLGSHRLLEERGQETPEMHERLEAMERDGSTIVVLGKDHHVCGMISVRDQIRTESKKAIRDMRASGIERIVMLTGDNLGTADAIAKLVDVDEAHAELLPEDKVANIEALMTRFGHVAMVGDGVNDAPAMARASIGIAMGAVGSDAAIETADVALMSDDLSKVAWLIRHSKRTINVIRQNITASVGIKVIFMMLTFMGFASLWSAIAADMGTSLLVIFNGLRLLRD